MCNSSYVIGNIHVFGNLYFAIILFYYIFIIIQAEREARDNQRAKAQQYFKAKIVTRMDGKEVC
jgi:hypothetical protein